MEDGGGVGYLVEVFDVEGGDELVVFVEGGESGEGGDVDDGGEGF